MEKQRGDCKACNLPFFINEEEDIVEGEPYCSYCLPYIEKCIVCDKNYKGSSSRKVKENTVCAGCREKYKISKGSGITNGWLIKRFFIFSRDGFVCRYCGRSPLEDKIKLHCDHIIPRFRGGGNENDNLITSCEDCNHGKMCVMLEESLITKLKLRKVKGDI